MNWIEGFISDCQARGMTWHSIQTYRSQVNFFLLKYNPLKSGFDDMRSFLIELRGKGLKGSTLRGYFVAISAFYDYLVLEGAIKSNPVPQFRKRYLRIKEPRNGENTRQLISIQDMQLLVSAAAGVQEKAIILTMAKTGIRRGELLDLTVNDIDIKNGIIRIPAKAKRSNQLAFMDDEFRDILEQYLSWREMHAKSDWLWITKSGGRIHKDHPGRILACLAENLGIHEKEGPICRRLTPHCCRHWFTTWLYRAGMDPEHIKFLRGDSLSSESWQIYNHIDIEEVRAEYLRRIPKLISFDMKISMFTE